MKTLTILFLSLSVNAMADSFSNPSYTTHNRFAGIGKTESTTHYLDGTEVTKTSDSSTNTTTVVVKKSAFRAIQDRLSE